MRTPCVLPHKQRGATLILTLLILVMIMMYGIPAAMDSIQNERMAGSTRNRDLAFQAAEHTLKRAENWLFTQTSATLGALAPTSSSCPGSADPDAGDCVMPNAQCHANDAAYWNAFNGSGGNVCVMTGLGNQLDNELVAAQPGYIVERMPDVDSLDGQGLRPYYRITARAVGRDSTATVILQTMYKF